MLFYCRNIILCSKNVACVEIFDELNGFGIVNFIDMGIKGNRTLKIIDVNGTLKFDAIK